MSKKCQNIFCAPLINEDKSTKKLYPILIIGLLFLITILILDFLYLEFNVYFYLYFIIAFLIPMLIKKIYIFFHLFTCLYIPIISAKIIGDLGTYLQVGMVTIFRKIIFSLKCFIFIFIFFIYYTYFQYYKCLKFHYITQIQKNISQETVIDDNDDQNLDDNNLSKLSSNFLDKNYNLEDVNI